MALIRLRVCAGWTELLLVAYTTLMEIIVGKTGGRTYGPRNRKDGQIPPPSAGDKYKVLVVWLVTQIPRSLCGSYCVDWLPKVCR